VPISPVFILVDDLKGHNLPSYLLTPYMWRSMIPLIRGWLLLRAPE